MASTMFITFNTPDIKGESIAPDQKSAIDVLSWIHAFNQPARADNAAGTVEQANHSDFQFTKYLDASSTALLKMCWSGKPVGSATFSAYRADGENKPVMYLKVDFANVIVSNVSIGGGTGDMATETITLGYSKVQYTYTQRKEDSAATVTHTTTHDLVKRAVS